MFICAKCGYARDSINNVKDCHVCKFREKIEGDTKTDTQLDQPTKSKIKLWVKKKAKVFLKI